MSKLKFKGISSRVVSSSQNLKKRRQQNKNSKHGLVKRNLAENLRKQKSKSNGNKDFKTKKFQAGGKQLSKTLFNKKDFKNKL